MLMRSKTAQVSRYRDLLVGLLTHSDNEEIVLWPEKEKSLVEGTSSNLQKPSL